jgi:hypothetical protein
MDGGEEVGAFAVAAAATRGKPGRTIAAHQTEVELRRDPRRQGETQGRFHRLLWRRPINEKCCVVR